MNKRDFLKTSGLLGLSTVIPVPRAHAMGEAERGACALIPGETAGPFPLDLTANSTYFRQDIREGEAGVPLRLRLRILGLDNCEPWANLRVNIWHCSAAGLYSGYSQNNNPGQAGLTYLRGYQFTDADGIAEFLTIFPGWYQGRICHIHFQVYVNSNYAAISQLTFPIAEKQAIYTANPTIYTDGQDPMTLNSDNVFSNGYEYQLATLTFNSTTQEYESALDVSVNGAGVVTGLQEALNGGQFSLGQNQPNPYQEGAVIPLELATTSDVRLTLFDLQGKQVWNQLFAGMAQGQHQLPVAPLNAGLPHANYIYEVEVTNARGVFRDARMMTAAR
ncbi:MAG TPA: hypothetical protein PL070_03145 [Flavobacteriales bacterium]|nr:hypothetical protein [Flavobacteriales bacterium]